MTKTIQKLFCKITLRSFVLVLGLMSVMELSARSEADLSGSAMTGPSTELQANNIRLTGRVVDENKAGVPGATIQVQGSTRGIITDNDGNFDINVKSNDVLVVSFLGYETQNIPVENRNHIFVELSPKSSELDAVTIVAYGSQRKESIVGSISTIDNKQLNISTGQLSSSLAGKLAGMVVMQRTGEPGAGSEFWIRGVNTFGAYNKPLVLVDGVERDMDLVDTDDIATFSILKDATATAVYGVRGANGIVLITTKRGMESKPKVSFKAEYGITQPVKLPKLANTGQWLDYFDELYRDAGSDPVISDYERQMYLSGADSDLYPSVDWVKTVFKNLAQTARINVNVSGGTPTVRYYVGASYYTEGGIFNMADNDRYDAQMNFNKFNFRSNVDINITKSTELSLSLSTQYTTKNAPATDMGNLYAYTMYVTPIATPTVFSDGTVANPEVGHNPYNLLNNRGYRRATNITSQSLLSLTQDFSDFVTPGLKANVKFSWDADNGNILTRSVSPTAYYVDPLNARDPDTGKLIFHQAGPQGTNYMELATSNSSMTTINLEASLVYDRLFAEDHRVSGLFLYSMRSRTNNVPANYIGAFPYRNMGIAGRVTYAFRDKYFFEANFGYNGSENFSPAKRFGFFPSVAMGYMISNEKFWEPLREKINYLKIRGSHGMVGNDQIGGNRRYAYNTTMDTSAPGFVFGSVGQNSQIGITTGDIGNPYVAWEESTKTDIGIEFGLFNKLRIQADYFYEKREGVYIPRKAQASVVGINVDQWVNLGRMWNQGFDVSLEFEHQFNRDLYISARGNFTYNRNKKLYDDMPDQINKYQNLAGFAVDQQFGLIAEGLFESQEDIDNWPKQTFSNVRPGDIKYRDINGDGKVDTHDRVAIGYTTVPEINYGFGVSMGYKGFDFSVFFSGVGNVTRIISGFNLFGASNNIKRLGQIYEDVALNRWTLDNQNPNAPYPRLSMQKVDNNMEPSTYWLRNMSFLRLKNAEIGYTIPKRLTEKIGMSTFRVYLQGVNLLTFSEFKLWDPELNANYGNVYPAIRTVTLGLNINF